RPASPGERFRDRAGAPARAAGWMASGSARTRGRSAPRRRVDGDHGAKGLPGVHSFRLGWGRMTDAIELRDVFRIYDAPEGASVALQGLSLTEARGEIVVGLGPSGSGKSTLLRIMAGLDEPSAGVALTLGVELSKLRATRRAAFRARHLGILDQHYARSLSPDLTCRETVEMRLSLLGQPRGARDRRADELLERVGLRDKAGERPAALSGGEQQRVAVCAALAHRPELLLADEPGGELDVAN